MITLDTKLGTDPRLPNDPAPTATYLQRLNWRLTDVLREHAQAINGQDVWEVLQAPASAIRPIASSAPTFNDDSLTQDFSATVTNAIGANFMMPFSWAEGTAIHVHAHIYIVSDPAGNNASRWKLEHIWFNADDAAIPDLATAGNWSSETITHTHPATGSLSDTIMFTPLVMTGATAEAMLKVKLSRIGGDGADTCTQVVKLSTLNLHYTRNTSGARQMDAK